MAKRRGSAQPKDPLELEPVPQAKTTGKRLPEPDVAAMAKRAMREGKSLHGLVNELLAAAIDLERR